MKNCKDCNEKISQKRTRCYDCGVLVINTARRRNGTEGRTSMTAFTAHRARLEQRRIKNGWSN